MFFMKYEGGGTGESNWPHQKKLPSKSPALLELRLQISKIMGGVSLFLTKDIYWNVCQEQK